MYRNNFIDHQKFISKNIRNGIEMMIFSIFSSDHHLTKFRNIFLRRWRFRMILLIFAYMIDQWAVSPIIVESSLHTFHESHTKDSLADFLTKSTYSRNVRSSHWQKNLLSSLNHSNTHSILHFPFVSYSRQNKVQYLPLYPTQKIFVYFQNLTIDDHILASLDIESRLNRHSSAESLYMESQFVPEVTPFRNR